MNKLLFIMMFISTVYARVDCTQPNSVGEYQRCEARAQGTGRGTGMRIFVDTQTYQIKKMSSDEYLNRCIEELKFNESLEGAMNIKFQKIFVNECLSVVGIRLQ